MKCRPCPENCDDCSSETVCTTCSGIFTLSSGECTCGYTATLANGCVSCVTGEYYDGINSCLTCPHDNCSACSSPDGDCTTCASTYTVQSDGTCTCATGYFLQSSSCVAYTDCGSGWYNDGANTCLECGVNCAECDDTTADCTSCSSGTVMAVLPSVCSCDYLIGPVDAPYTCVAAAYSSERVLEPFASNLSVISWQDWGIINDV